MIPPSAYDTYDTTAILRNMESMKSQIDMLTEAQKVTSELITSLPLADNRLQINRNNPQQRAPGELMTPNPPKESVTQSVANSKNHSEEQQVDIKVVNNDNDEDDNDDEDDDDDDDYDDDDSDNDDEDVDAGDDDGDNDDDDVAVNNEDTDIEGLQIPSAQPPKVNNLSTIQQYRGGKTSNSYQKHWSKHTSLKADKDFMYAYSKSGSKQTIETRTFVNSQYMNKLATQGNARDKMQSYDGVTIGTGPVTALKAVSSKSKRPYHTSHSNRRCTGLFISRLQPQFTAPQVQTHVWQQAGLRIKAEKIPTRYSSYSSFYVPCDRQVMEDMQDPSIWPVGTLVKPYFS